MLFFLTGRQRSSWCEWNSGFPGLSRSERRQGKLLQTMKNSGHFNQYLAIHVILFKIKSVHGLKDFFLVFFRVLVDTLAKR